MLIRQHSSDEQEQRGKINPDGGQARAGPCALRGILHFATAKSSVYPRYGRVRQARYSVWPAEVFRGRVGVDGGVRVGKKEGTVAPEKNDRLLERATAGISLPLLKCSLLLSAAAGPAGPAAAILAC